MVIVVAPGAQQLRELSASGFSCTIDVYTLLTLCLDLGRLLLLSRLHVRIPLLYGLHHLFIQPTARRQFLLLIQVRHTTTH